MGENLILRFYDFFNGQPVAIEQLIAYRQKVEQYVDSIGSGEYVPKLSAIKNQVTRVIKDWQAKGITDVDKLELVNNPKPSLSAPPPAAFAAMAERGTLWPSKRKDPSNKMPDKKATVVVKEVEKVPENVVALDLPISQIHTDTKRFQNRQGAFSEASAQSVAENYDPNKFDPIVVWKDPVAKKLFVLSGHSRLEGMIRRKSKTIAVRYFKGSEDKAIQFAKVEANRAANQENLIEDLAAYKLMRDGDAKRKISKATKGELSKIFKGKAAKLESYSYLSERGLFVEALNQSSTSNYPYIERNAQWVGILRMQYPVISNQGEDNIFHFFYSDKSGKNIKLSKDEFFALAKKKINQLRKGESVLFPECSSEGCKQTVDKESDAQKGEGYKRLREINEQLETITEKLTSKDASKRVTTDEEKKYLRTVAEKLQQEKERINRDFDLLDKSQNSLFGATTFFNVGMEMEFNNDGDIVKVVGNRKVRKRYLILYNSTKTGKKYSDTREDLLKWIDEGILKIKSQNSLFGVDGESAFEYRLRMNKQQGFQHRSRGKKRNNLPERYKGLSPKEIKQADDDFYNKIADQEVKKPKYNLKGHYIINGDRKAELHLDYASYKALPQEAKNLIKSGFIWGRGREAWISRGGYPNWNAQSVIKAFALPFEGKDERSTFEERMNRKESNAGYRQTVYAERASKAMNKMEQLQSEFNRLRKDWSWLTQPINYSSSGGRAFANSKAKVMARYEKGFEEYAKSKYYRERSANAGSSLKQLTDANFLQRRIKDAEASIKKIEKWVNPLIKESEKQDLSDDRKLKVEEYLEHGLERLQDNFEKKAFYSAKLIELQEQTGVKVFTKETLEGAEYVKLSRGWYKVIRVNPTTVTHSWFVGDFKHPLTDIEDAVYKNDKYTVGPGRIAGQYSIEIESLKGPQIDAFNIEPKKKKRSPLNELQMAQLQDAIKAGRTPKVNLKAKMNATKKPAPLFDEPVNDPRQASLFGQKKSKSLSGIDYTYTPVSLGPYQKDFNRLFSDTVVGIYGLPGHGKTTYLLVLAQYLATQGKKVLFVAREEYGRSEFDIKLKEHNIGHPNLTFNKQLEANELKAADVVFLDSVNALKLDASGVEKIYHQYPNKLWFLILQSIKSGNFRGSQEWEHVVSVFGEIQNRKLILRKNRLDPNNSTKAEALNKTNAITEAKKKAEVREAVKNAMNKSKQPLTQPIAA